jgi:NADPH-dependent 2,4-dienoyl-CoA reductase/sulfur reductase-like enzyme
LGSELVAFSALLTCRHVGIRPAAMIEPGPRVVARWPAPLLPWALRVPLFTRTEIVAVEGRDRVEAVVVRGPQGERRIEADGLLVTGQFRPEAALLAASHLAIDRGTGGPEVDEYGRCTDPSFFAAGNLLRTVETAGWCWAEGRAVAGAILKVRAGALPEGPGHRLEVVGEALAWVVPQRVAGDGRGAALSRLQLRARRAARGRLGLRTAGQEVAGRDLVLRPERRILLPLPDARAPAAVLFREEPS